MGLSRGVRGRALASSRAGRGLLRARFAVATDASPPPRLHRRCTLASWRGGYDRYDRAMLPVPLMLRVAALLASSASTNAAAAFESTRADPTGPQAWTDQVVAPVQNGTDSKHL
jgi:hypothetical protein